MDADRIKLEEDNNNCMLTSCTQVKQIKLTLHPISQI